MGSASAQMRRVHALEKVFWPPRQPREWLIALEDGEPMSDELLEQIAPFDRLFVRRYPAGYMPEDSDHTQTMSCFVGSGRWKKPLVVRDYGIDMSKV